MSWPDRGETAKQEDTLKMPILQNILEAVK